MRLFGPPNIYKLQDEKNVRGLIKALGYQKDEFIRREAALGLNEIGDPRAVEPLITVLKDEDSYVRQEAAKALGTFGDPRAMEPLITVLKDEDSYVRKAAAVALGQIGDSRAVKPLITALKDKVADVREASAVALGQIGDTHAVESLITALKDEVADVRKAVVQSLDKIGWQPDEGTNGVAYWIAKEKWDRCVQIGASAVEPLVAALKDKDADVRKAAASALGRIGDVHVVEPLINTLGDRNRSVRQAALKALVEINDPRAVKPLITQLKHPKKNVRRDAAKALVAMYQSAGLGKKHQQLVLEQRQKIIQSHKDQKYSVYISNDCYDYRHEDNKGIGVSFPV